MSAQFEDGPPCIQSRSYPHKDVIDLANALCMEARAKKLRESQERARLALPYQVHFGTAHCHTQHFGSFDRALEFTIDHIDDEFQPALVGFGHDAERDGLTSDERDVVAEAYQMRTPRNARRA